MANIVKHLFKSRQKRNYDVRRTAVDDRKNLGNNYADNVLRNSLSAYILRNKYMNDFVVMIQKIIGDLIDSVTYLKGYKSFTTKKDYKNFR